MHSEVVELAQGLSAAANTSQNNIPGAMVRQGPRSCGAPSPTTNFETPESKSNNKSNNKSNSTSNNNSNNNNNEPCSHFWIKFQLDRIHRFPSWTRWLLQKPTVPWQRLVRSFALQRMNKCVM